MRLLFGLLLTLLSLALKATDVSGLIDSDRTWGANLSPYIVTGDITITARLTVDAGVQMYMSPGTNITVTGGNGALLLKGTPAAPILLTSIREQAGSAVAAAPGDWGQLTLQTNGSYIDNARIRFGHGINIVGSSPGIYRTQIDNHLGPAISIDLNSSPRGDGLSASGNTVNGIVVPAGEITSRTHWQLRGIAYVVQSGIVHVGNKPPALLFDPTDDIFPPNSSATVQLVLSDPAPTGGVAVTLSSSNPTSVSAPASVSIAAGNFATNVPLTIGANGDALISATSSVGKAQATYFVRPRPVLTFNNSAPNVAVGRTITGSISSSQAAPAGGIAVTLSFSPTGIASVATTVVTIPAGQFQTAYSLTGITVGNTDLTASNPGYDGATVPVVVRPLTLTWPSNLTAPLGAITFPLQLSDPAPPGGMTLNLSSSATNILSVPASISVPAGANTAQVPVTGLSLGSANITASNVLYGTATAPITVQQIDVLFDVASRTIPQGMTEPFRVLLSRPAPVGGTVVNISSSAPGIAAPLQTSVTVPQGLYQALVLLDVQALTQGDTTITGSGNGLVSGTLAITVGGPAQLSFVDDSYLVGRGLSARSARVRLTADGAPYQLRRPLIVNLSNSDSSKLFVPTTVTIVTSASEVSFAMNGLALTSSAVTLSASAANVVSTTTPMNVSVIDPTLSFERLDNLRGLLDGRDEFAIKWTVAGSSESEQIATSTQNFALSVVNPTPANVVSGIFADATGSNSGSNVTIAAGSNNSTSRYVAAPSAIGSYQVRASLVGYADTTSNTQTVAGLSLRFDQTSVIVGKGMRSQFYVRLQRFNGGNLHAPATALSVALTSSDPSRVSVPAFATIPANASFINVSLTGVALTSNTVISATAAGYDNALPLTVSVVEPTLSLTGLAGERTVGGSKDDFSVRLSVPSSADFAQTAASAITIPLSIVDANPPGIIPGFFGPDFVTPATELVITANQNSAGGYVASPTETGSYKVSALIQGNAASAVISALQTVGNNIASFAESSVTVSAGLRANATLRLSDNAALPVSFGVACTPSTVCSVPSPVGVQYTSGVSIPIIGVAPGKAVLNVTPPAPSYGAPSIPVTVVPMQLTLDFSTAGADQESLQVLFATPGGLNVATDVTVSLIEQSTPNLMTFADGSISMVTTINEGGSQTNLLTLNTPTSVGTFKVRVEIPGVTTWTSPVLSSILVHAEPSLGYDLVVGLGLKTAVNLLSNLPVTTATVVGVTCIPTSNCVPIMPSFAPGTSTTSFDVVGVVEGINRINFNSPLRGIPTRSFLISNPSVNSTYSNYQVAVGSDVDITLTLTTFTFSGTPSVQRAVNPIAFTLQSSNAAIASVPGAVVIAPDESSVTFKVRGLSPGFFAINIDSPTIGSFSTATLEVVP
jgi:trimeric autotransporter adhesin